MSSLTRFTPLIAQARSAAVRTYAPAVSRSPAWARTISSTPEKDMGPVEAAKDTLKKADRKISDAAVKGIDKGEKARDALKDNIGIVDKEAKAKAEHMKGEAEEFAGQGKGKAEQAAGYVKGKTEKALGEDKGRSGQSPNIGS